MIEIPLKYYGLVVSVLFAISVKGQSPKYWSFEAGLTQNHSEILGLYNGALFLNTTYEIPVLEKLYLGGSLAANWMNRVNTSARAQLVSPAIQLTMPLWVSEKMNISPGLSGGLSWLFIQNTEYAYKESQMGMNVSALLKVEWWRNYGTGLYFTARLSQINLTIDREFTELASLRQMWISSLGLGIKFKSSASNE